jgi:hypothetical protein
MRPRSSTRQQQQRSLLPIPEQSAHHPEPEQQTSSAFSSDTQADEAADPPAEPWFGLDDSPFAAAEAPAELVAAMEAAAAAGVTGLASFVPQATSVDAAAGSDNSSSEGGKGGCAKTKSLPALQATTAANRSLKDLPHRSSCSALPGRTGSPQQQGLKTTPLQV